MTEEAEIRYRRRPIADLNINTVSFSGSSPHESRLLIYDQLRVSSRSLTSVG